MTTFWRYMSAGLALVFVAASAEPARAQLALNASSGNGYSYANLGFSFSTCTINGNACASNTRIQLAGISSVRGTRTFDIMSTVSQTTNILIGNNKSLTFSLLVTPLTGSAGVSSIQVSTFGSSSTGDNTLVSATATGAPGLTPASVVGILGTPGSGTQTFVPVGSSETINMSLNTGGVGTLRLLDVKLLFYAAPEPASIALFLSGLAGLTVARRRFKLRQRSTTEAT
jgi:hypothetical protein